MSSASRTAERTSLRQRQRGAYAVEFALVFPMFLLFTFSIYVFSFAFMSRHLLGNVAAETARQCVSRSNAGQGAVESCVQPLGHYLANKLPIICLGGPVQFEYNVASSGASGLGNTFSYPTDERFLIVSAFCNWTFVPVKNVLRQGPVDMPDQDRLKGMAAVPFTVYVGGA